MDMTSSSHQSQSYTNNSLQHQAHSSTGYSYQQEASIGPTYRNTIATNYSTTSNEGYGSSTYGSQQYGTYLHGTGQERSDEQAATSTQTSSKQSSYGQQETTGVSHQSNHTGSSFNPTSWANGTYGANVYGHSSNQVTDRSQNASTTSGYSAQASASNELPQPSIMNPSQTTSGTYKSQNFRPMHSAISSSTEQSYHTYQQPTQATQHQFHQRYNSPSHAVQAQNQQKTQHGGHIHPSVAPSNSLSSLHMTANQQQLNSRQNSGSAEPQQMTVNPSQVYDARAEQQRKAQIEADRKRRREEEAAKRKAEEDHIAEERRKLEEARTEEQIRKDREAAAVLDRQRAEQAAAEQLRSEQEAAARKAEEVAVTKKLKAEQRKKANEEKRQSQTAASALQQMASGNAETGVRSGASMQPESTSEEAQMRAMFARMREFNAKNPNMLAKLWEEERQFANSQSPQPSPAPVHTPDQRQAPIADAQQQQQQQQQQVAASELSVTYSTPTLPPPLRPFLGPTTPLPAKASNGKQSAKPRAQVPTPLWPKQKRPAISEVAVKWLMSLPSNAGKVFRSADILRILDGNPSYAQLCAGLQNLGAQFDQSLLARVILRGVPDLLPPKTPGPEPARRPSNQPTSQSNVLTVAYDTPNFSSASAASIPHISAPNDVLDRLHGASNAQINTASAQLHNSISGQPSNGSVAPIEPEKKPTLPSPIRPPANKEEAARKRKITDLVDLTASDSDDEGPPTKMVMLQSGPGPVPGFQPPPMMDGTPMVSTHAMRPPDQSQRFVERGVLVPPRQLVAAPRPVVKPPHVKAPHPPAGTKGPTPEQLQQERMKGKMLIEPIMRDRVARKSRYDSRTIARDVLLATGRHPDMRPLNQHLIVMSKLLSDHGAQQDTDGTRGLRADLATIRWDVIDPELPASVGATPKPTTTVKDHIDAESEVTHTQSPATPAATKPHNSVPQPRAGAVAMATGVRIQAKRGRPRKVVQEQLPTPAGPPVSSSTEAHQTPVIPTTELDNTTSHSPSPSAMSASGGAVGYAAFRKYDENGNVIKTKGRPKGWKKSLHGRQAQGLQPSASGPPSRSKTKSSILMPLTEAQPQVYKCKWEACPSELHNLETLKKHVVKLHDEENDAGEYVCRWKDCSISALLPDFQSWTEHIYEAHMNPVAWKQGDGPKGGVSDFDPADAELYLSDAHGRSVTPIIDPDTSTPPKKHHNAAAALKGLIDHRRIVGPSFEKGGCTLANGKRRRGFLDDEDFEYHYEEDEDRF